MFRAHGFDRSAANTAGIPGMTPVHLALFFIAGYPHFFRIHDDDVVTGVDMGSKLWLVFATQATGCLLYTSDAADD